MTIGEIKDRVVRPSLRKIKESLENNGYRYREIMNERTEEYRGRFAVGLCCDAQSFIVKYINNRGPLSLVSTTEGLLDRKVVAPV
jgi:hypothetical protein